MAASKMASWNEDVYSLSAEVISFFLCKLSLPDNDDKVDLLMKEFKLGTP